MKWQDFKIEKGTTIISNGKQTLMLRYDNDPDNPRKEWDNVCSLYCWHRHYDLGDKHNFSGSQDFLVWLLETYADPEDVRNFLIKEEAEEDGIEGWIWTIDEISKLVKDNVEMERVSLYDHSGLSVSLGGSAGWDTGVVGIIWCDKEKALRELRRDMDWHEAVQKAMSAEIRIYDLYLTGDCYGWQYYEGFDECESCWGYYPDLGDVFGSEILYEALSYLEGDSSEYKQFHGDYHENIDDFLKENFRKDWVKSRIYEIDEEIDGLKFQREILTKEAMED